MAVTIARQDYQVQDPVLITVKMYENHLSLKLFGLTSISLFLQFYCSEF